MSLLILADQASNDDLFTGQALCGEAGQWLGGFLRAAGIRKRYLIVRTLPVDTLDLTTAKRDSLVDDAAVRNLKESQRARSRPTPSVTALLVGPFAQRLAPNVVPAGLTIVDLERQGAAGWQASWQAALTLLQGRNYTKDVNNPTFTMPSQRSQLPRFDAPYGTPRWVGTSGNRGVRPGPRPQRPSPDYLKVFIPSWVNALDAAPLSAANGAAVNQLALIAGAARSREGATCPIDPGRPVGPRGSGGHDGSCGTFDDGRVYIQGRDIKDVRKASDGVPQGFAAAPHVKSGGTIYPGLIELHNHLAYNAMPLWDVPQQYFNNSQWRSPTNPDYRTKM